LNELEENEERFRTLSNAMPQFVWTSDADGALNYFNEAVYEYSGLAKELVDKEGWLRIIHPDDAEENLKLWIHSVETGQPFLFEHRFRRHDGVYRWQLSRAVPQKDENGHIRIWVGTSTDIDDIKKHEEQKNDFIKMANHELKTPVTTIKGYVQLLLKTHGNSGDAILSKSLITVDRQVTKLTNLISDLLDVTRIDSGKLPLNNEVFCLEDLVRDTIKDIKAATQTHEIIYNSNSDANVFADKDRISQVLLNLFTNAFKYSPKADKIIIEINNAGNDVVVSVQDFGIGIDKEDLENIFERFYRVAGKDEKTFPGFGIGLFIVKEIIVRHNGNLWVNSEKGAGSVFYFSLPIHL
ncbi:MAG: PAS domain-containing sensor histidine kinase, partial [Ferruginibacter sp.]